MDADFSHSQLDALHAAQAVLAAAGLMPGILSRLSSPSSSRAITPHPPSLTPSQLFPNATLLQPPAPAVITAWYEPPHASTFTDADIASGRNKVTREAIADRIVEHPLGAIVEYPETGDSLGVAIAHIFNVDMDPERFIHPRLNFQYSLGDGHGGRDNVTCRLLKSRSGGPVLCKKLRTSCKFSILKYLIYVSFSQQAKVSSTVRFGHSNRAPIGSRADKSLPVQRQ